MSSPSLIERALLHDRTIVIIALGVLIAASWVFVLVGAGTGMSAWDMTSWKMALGLSGPMRMAMPVEWTLGYAAMMFFMWWIMMVAMMLPSAAPMILLHAKVTRASSERTGGVFGLAPTALFTIGYLAAWAVFSLIATSLQWAFEGLGVLSPMTMSSTNQLFAGVILLFAGAYQLTPLKQACLKHCRSPVAFLSRHWRPGATGAFRMGLGHGAYCLGCCWGLMALLFFGGIMNLYWVIGLAVLVLLEKLLPAGQALAYGTGAIFLSGGIYLLSSIQA